MPALSIKIHDHANARSTLNAWTDAKGIPHSPEYKNPPVTRRKCSGCTTWLSRWNSLDVCSPCERKHHMTAFSKTPQP